MDINSAIDWIEKHEHTVDVLKWVVAGAAVWASGLFKFLRGLSQKPKVEIDSRFSSWYCESFKYHGADKVEFPLVILADLRVSNPTREKLGVSRFEVQVRRQGWWPRWYPPISNTGLPALPTIPLAGNAEKLLRVWFDRFPDSPDSTARTVDAQHADSAHALFAMLFSSETFSSADGKLELKVRAYLGTGDVVKTIAVIGKRRGFAALDRLVANGTHFALLAAKFRRVA